MKTVLVLWLLLSGAAGPYDIPLFNSPAAPTARGSARLIFAASPFGVAVLADGVASYDVQVDISGLPDASTLGPFTTYVAWTATTDLSRWQRLGLVGNGTTRVGPAELNKFLLVITAEADSLAVERKGPTVLHGTSPSGWLQSFVSHPLFRNLPPE